MAARARRSGGGVRGHGVSADAAAALATRRSLRSRSDSHPPLPAVIAQHHDQQSAVGADDDRLAAQRDPPHVAAEPLAMAGATLPPESLNSPNARVKPCTVNSDRWNRHDGCSKVQPPGSRPRPARSPWALPAARSRRAAAARTGLGGRGRLRLARGVAGRLGAVA